MVRSPILRTTMGSGITLMDALAALVVTGLIAALIIPILERNRDRENAANCMSNMRRIGQAMALYLHDYDETYPMSRFPDATHPAGGCIKPENNQPEDNLQGSRMNWKRALRPYQQNASMWMCPTNAYAWAAGGYNGIQNFGDETNVFFPHERDWLPISYALNGSFFHEAIPPCWMGEKRVRGRYTSEIQSPANLLLLLETRETYPDLGDWWLTRRLHDSRPRDQEGPIQTHNGLS